MSLLGEFGSGLSHVRVGFDFLKSHRGLWKWAMAPFFIAVLLFGFFMVSGLGWISGWVQSALASLAVALGWIGLGGATFLLSVLNFLLGTVLWVVYLIFALYGTFLVTALIAAPFNSLLAEQTLVAIGAIEDRPFILSRWLKMTIRLLGIGVLKSVIFLFLGLLIFLCSFVPVLNLAGAFVALLIMAFDSMDYSFEVFEMSLADRFRFFRLHFSRFAGSAGFLGLTLLLPGITLLLLPFSVVGSAVAMAEIRRRRSR